MAAIPANLARVSIHWKPDQSAWPDEQAVNTFHVSFTDTTPPANWSVVTQQIADKVFSVLQTHWAGIAAYHGAGYQIDQIKVAALDTSNHTTEEAVHAVGGGVLAGTASGGVMPPEVAVCLSLYGYAPGGFTSRRGTKRGRMYLPYIAASASGTDGKLSTSAWNGIIAAWQPVFADFRPATITDGTFTAVILSTTAGTATDIPWLAIDDHFDSQRRRQHQSPAKRQVVTVP